MPELRISLPPGVEVTVVEQLTAALSEALAGRPLRALPHPDDDGHLVPAVRITARTGDELRSALAAVARWGMQHPDVPVRLHATGPGGRLSLELRRFSAVAFADASRRILAISDDS